MVMAGGWTWLMHQSGWLQDLLERCADGHQLDQ